MRILHVITSVNPSGGGPIEGLKQLAGVLKQHGHTVEVASLDDPEAPWIQEFPHVVYPLGPPRLTYAYSNRIIPWLQRRRTEFDVVIVNGIWQFGSYAVHKVLHGTSTPYVVYTHGMLDPWFKHAYPLKHLKKQLYWRMGEYPVLRDACAVLFTCEEERVLARESFRPYRCREVVVNYGTGGPVGDLGSSKSVFLERYPHLRGKRLLLFLSRIHPKKGCDLLLDAFAKVGEQAPDLHLVMAGPDQSGWQPELESRADRLGISARVTWTGMLRGELKWGAYAASEAFILPSHQENFGIVVAESMACGTPVLITDKVNIWREINTDSAGIVETDDVEGVTRQLQRWLNLLPQERAAMGACARLSFERHFEIHAASVSLMAALTEATKVRQEVCPLS